MFGNMKVATILFTLFLFALAKPNVPGWYHFLKHVLSINYESFIDVPMIKVSQDRSRTSIPEVQITFPNGHEDRLVLHRHFVNQAERMEGQMNCNYLGHLEVDTAACVAVTGCLGEDMELTINSKHNTKTNMYLLKKSGDVELLPRPFSVSFII